MVGLMDAVPLSTVVQVNGKPVDCYGLTLENLAYLFMRFPELKDAVDGDFKKITVKRIFEVAPQTIMAIISCGTGTPKDEKAEKHAAKFPIETQYDLLKAIIGMTMPGGVDPFWERVNEVRALVIGFTQGLEERKAALASNSSPQPKDLSNADTSTPTAIPQGK